MDCASGSMIPKGRSVIESVNKLKQLAGVKLIETRL